MIEEFAAEFTVRELCQTYEVSRNGYDQWKRRHVIYLEA